MYIQPPGYNHLLPQCISCKYWCVGVDFFCFVLFFHFNFSSTQFSSFHVLYHYLNYYIY